MPACLQAFFPSGKVYVWLATVIYGRQTWKKSGQFSGKKARQKDSRKVSIQNGIDLAGATLEFHTRFDLEAS
jgi:hypothetical protein